MAITVDQLPTLKTWVNARLAENNQQNEAQLAALANATASPAYFALKTSLGRHEVTDQPDVETDGVTPTSFVWGGSTGGYINRSQGERDAWMQLFNSTGNCKPNLANVRTAFMDIFSGNGAGAIANRKHIIARFQRPCTVAEKLYVIATVGGPAQSGSRGSRTNPDTLVFEGLVTAQNIIDAQNLPS